MFAGEDTSGRAKWRKVCRNKVPELAKKCCQKREDRQRENRPMISIIDIFKVAKQQEFCKSLALV